MIVIKLEMWPGGDEARKYDLGRAFIWNDGRVADPRRGDYGVAIQRRGYTGSWVDVVRGQKAQRRGEVKDYPRLAYPVWRLIIRALRSAFPEES